MARANSSSVSSRISPYISMCSNAGGGGSVETISVAVTDGQKIYVAAEGALSSKGGYTITFALP